jgi:hypothetical protein
VTRKGHRIVVSDADGEEHVEIATKDGKVRILLDHDAGGLTIETESDVTIHAKGNLGLAADRDLTLTARGSATITADTGLTLTSHTDVTVQGNPIKLN